MTFKEHYQREKTKIVISPARAFIIAISASTGRSEKTVRQWLSGIQEPSMTNKEKISRCLRQPVEELFPSI